MTRIVLIFIALAAAFPIAAGGESPGDQIVTTRRQIKVGQRALRYTARAGRLPIRHNETGEIHGHMFFVAYLLDRLPSEPARPLTFLWNGGPGSNSTLVHLSGFGPKRIKSNDDQNDRGDGAPDCECELEDNQSTWLDQTDLVFVDPIGAGFSRPTRAEYAAEFYNTLGDIASVTEFVRVYLTRFDAWDAPLFIGGESYGVWRAAGVAEALAQRRRKVAGVILISGGIPVGPALSDEMRTALFVPTRTAAAFFHKKLPPELQTDLGSALEKAERWARAEYAPALAKRDKLSEPERQNILAQLARFTGIDASLIDAKTLVLARQQFAEQLLRDRKQALARFDTRQIVGSETPARAERANLINEYLRSTLRFKTDLAYQGIEEGFSPSAGWRTLSVGARWNYNQGPPPPPGAPLNTDAPPGGSQPWLRRAIALDPSIKAFVAAGLYDSLNSCAGNAYLVSQLEPELKRNITAACYEGGHMMYESRDARRRLKQDVSGFMLETLAGRSK
ncbi:MAG TPA: peptidase S10 [Blastocatellia bacterium]|nr:peptidase S10 [Blastocatellia bacterium]